MREGIVSYFNVDKGYGFIKSNDESVFFHFRYILGKVGRKSLEVGERVRFIPDQNEKGKFARDIDVLSY